MAIGLDLLIVGLECAMLVTAGTRAYRFVARFANPAVIVAFLCGRLASTPSPSWLRPPFCGWLSSPRAWRQHTGVGLRRRAGVGGSHDRKSEGGMMTESHHKP